MTESTSRLDALLERWRAGDEAALAAILDAVLPRLQAHARKRLGRLRGKMETQDAVQDAVANFLRDAPRLVIDDEAQLVGLLRVIVDNVVRGHHRYFQRKRRQLSREHPVTDIAAAALDSSTPSRGAKRDERDARVRLALELLDPVEQRIICMRVYDELGHAEIADAVGLGEAAVRQRFRRGMQRLEAKVRQLEAGDVAGFLET